MTALRAVRATWTRERSTQHSNEEHNMLSNDDQMLWEFDRAGHASLGERTLVISAALRHIETRRVGLYESRHDRRAGPT